MPRPHQSQPPLEDVIAELTQAVGQLFRHLRNANPGDLNLSQASVLARLQGDGAMTTADLARAEGMTPQSMKTILAGLEEEACVERAPHPSDGRQVLFSITRKGLDERKRRTAAKRQWLLARLEQFDAKEVATLAAAVPLIKRLGDAPPR